MTCCRCDRKIDNTAEAIRSPYRKVHYCPPSDWPECDRVYAEKMKRLREEAA